MMGFINQLLQVSQSVQLNMSPGRILQFIEIKLCQFSMEASI